MQKENKKVTYPIVITPDQDELLKDLNIKETSDNTIIFQKLREYYNQIKTEKLRAIGNLILKVNGIDTEDDNKKKETVNMLNIWKQKLKDIKEKCEKINIMELRTILEDDKATVKNKGKEVANDNDNDNNLIDKLFGSDSENNDEDNNDDEDDDEDDDEFEEVPLDIKINTNKNKPKKSNANVVSTNSVYNKVFNIDYDNYKDIEKDPTVMDMNKFKLDILKMEEKEKNEPTIPENIPDDLKELYKTAPVVEFNDDLLYWGRTKIQFNEFSGMERSHRFFGVSEGNNYISDETLERLQKRAIYFPKKERVIYPECRARMPNGTLCKRRDIHNCPFHGKIIPRDDEGNPIVKEDDNNNNSNNNPKDDTKNSTTKNNQNPSTSNETFLAKKRRLSEMKKAKEKTSNIIDIKKINNTPKNRIMNALRKKEKKTNVDAILRYDAKMKYRNKKAFLWE